MRRLPLKERALFCVRLARFVRAGIPLHESLGMIDDPTARALRERIEAGEALAPSLAHLGWKDFEVQIVALAEEIGTLSESLSALGEELARRDTVRRRVFGALTYPALIALATVFMTSFLMLYLFPRILPVFHSLHVPLPLSTRIVMAVASLLTHWWWALLIAMLLVTVGCVVCVRRYPKFVLLLARLQLRTPGVRAVSRAYELSTSLRALGLLLAKGMPLSRALALAGATTTNPQYRVGYEALAQEVEAGGTLAFTDRFPYLFPPVVGQLATTGERSGSLAESVAHLALLYETELDEYTHTLSTLIEPALMLVMGFVVGFIAISIIAPVYGITAHLH